MTEPEHGTPEYWVRTRPDTPAVIKGHEVLTYGEWNERGDRVAEGLAALGLTDRIKDMIVAGGVNIYPAEIEKALVQHPDVVDAAVIGIPEPDFGEQPLAFVVAAQQPPPTAKDLLAFLDGRLASFKKPRQFVFVRAAGQSEPQGAQDRAPRP